MEAVTLCGVGVSDQTSQSNTPSSRQDMPVSQDMSCICDLSYQDRFADNNSLALIACPCDQTRDQPIEVRNNLFP